MGEPEDLVQRELLVFVGKGGVGKTTTSSAVALRLARRGRRTLLVTIDPAQRLADSLGVRVGHRVTQVRGNLYAMMLDPEKAIADYLREHAPDLNLTEHPFYKYLSNYMPGINELLAIGKLIEFRQEKHFDTIVVDTAPTGHALSFLTTPLKVRSLLRENLFLRWAVRGYALYRRLTSKGRAVRAFFGKGDSLPPVPDLDLEKTLEELATHIGGIHDLLQDPKRTTLLIVTHAEKLPVAETFVLHDYLAGELGVRVGYLVVNRLQPDALDRLREDFARLRRDAEAQRDLAERAAQAGYDKALVPALIAGVTFSQARRAMNLDRLQELTRRLPDIPVVHVPLFAEDVRGLDRLEAFEEAFFKDLAVRSAPRARTA